MKCPYCTKIDNKVIDSRLSKDGRMIRRRRECVECGRRFTTYEKLEDVLPMVVKKDGRREPFNRDKIIDGIRLACRKRPISMAKIEEFVDSLEVHFQELGKKRPTAQKSAKGSSMSLKSGTKLPTCALHPFTDNLKTLANLCQNWKRSSRPRTKSINTKQPKSARV